MNLVGKEISPDMLVQVKIEAEGNLVFYGYGTVAQVLERDWSQMDMDCDDYTLKKATLEIRTLPDHPSEEGAEGEHLGTIGVSLFDEDEPDPPMKINNLTGYIQMGWGSWSYHIPSIQCKALNDVRLKKQGIYVGHRYIQFEDFESWDQDFWGSNFEWFIGGESVDADNCRLYSPRLWTELANDLSYIFNYTKKDAPKTFSYLTSSGPDVVNEILDLVILMPEEKRRHILCDQSVLQETIRRYLNDGRIEPL